MGPSGKRRCPRVWKCLKASARPVHAKVNNLLCEENYVTRTGDSVHIIYLDFGIGIDKKKSLVIVMDSMERYGPDVRKLKWIHIWLNGWTQTVVHS